MSCVRSTKQRIDLGFSGHRREYLDEGLQGSFSNGLGHGFG